MTDTEQRPLQMRDLPAAIFNNRWAKTLVALFLLIELYNLAGIPAFLSTQKSIETKAIAYNADLKQKAEADLAEQKALGARYIALIVKKSGNRNRFNP